MTASIGVTLHLPLPFAHALSRTREALSAEGFGVLTQVDLADAFREKLGREFRPYVILGACNPALAYAAVQVEPAVGLLLPCNVTVESAGPDQTVVRLTDPATLLIGRGLPAEVERVAEDARERLLRVSEALAAKGT